MELARLSSDDEQGRPPFSSEELCLIVSRPWFVTGSGLSVKKPAAWYPFEYWLPLLGLYAGLRIAAAAQNARIYVNKFLRNCSGYSRVSLYNLKIVVYLLIKVRVNQMSELKLIVKGRFETDNFIYQHYSQVDNIPPQIDIVKELKEAAKLLSGFGFADFKIVVHANVGKGLNVKIDLGAENLISGKGINVTSGSNIASLHADVDGEFLVDVDVDSAKQMKKAFSSSKLKFFVTNIVARKEIADPYGFLNVSGTISGGEWDDVDSWPAVSLFESPIFSKKSTAKAKQILKVPVKVSTEIFIEKNKVEAVQKAIEEGMTMRIGLTIPGGVNGFLVKQSDWAGRADFSLNGNFLQVNIDAVHAVEVDAWMKKYKSKAPFGIELECIFDGESDLHYFGGKDAGGFFASLKVGEISF